VEAQCRSTTDNMMPRSLACHGMVSAICFTLYMTIVAVSDALSLHWTIVIAFAFIFNAICGYVLHARYTWDVSMSISAFLRYFVGLVSVLPVNVGVIFVLHSLLGLALLPATFLTVCTSLGLNFVATRWALSDWR
jgi:putative flippase GtrA